jgi:hypothetical protein
MSTVQKNLKQLSVKYCDLSSNNDNQLKLMSSMLLKLNDVLEVKELKILGEIIDTYINQKILLDHYFWGRDYRISNLSKEEVDLQVGELKKS